MFTATNSAAEVSAIIDRARAQITESDRDAAAREWVEAKRAEEAAKSARLTAEAKIIALFGAKPEGSQTVKSSLFAVKTTGAVTYKIDEAAYLAAKSEIPKAVRDACVRTKFEASVSGMKALEKSDPAMYAKVAAFLSITPAKTAVSVEILKM